MYLDRDEVVLNGLSLHRPFFILIQNFFAKASKYFYGIDVGQFYEEHVVDDFIYQDC